MHSHVAFLDGIGGPELLLIFILSLMLFGGKKLPEVARGVGRSIREFKRAAAGVEQEIKRAIEQEPPPPAVRRPPPAAGATAPVGKGAAAPAGKGAAPAPTNPPPPEPEALDDD